MNPEKLKALFAEHRTAILGAAAAGVTGLALLHRKQSGGDTGATSSSPAGTIPAAAIAAQPTGSYDSSAYDVYSALQSELGPVLEQLREQGKQSTGGGTGGGVTKAPGPLASGLLAPTYNGKYVRFSDGLIAEMESDGSLFWLNPTESKKAFGGKSWAGRVNQLNVKAPSQNIFSTAKNLLAKQPTAAK